MPEIDLKIEESRILIVDDQEANVLFLEGLLEQGGYRHWRCLCDSRASAAVCAEFRPDLVLLDWLMPGLDGLGVLEALRPYLQEEIYLPVLVLTVDISAEAKRRALAAGAKDFLAKPLDAVEVLLRVRNLLETRFLYRRLRERADERIREQAALIDQANDAIMVFDLNDHIAFWNRAAELTYGWTQAEVLGQSALELLSSTRTPGPSGPATPPTTRMLAETGSWSGELQQRGRDGREMIMASRWTLLRDSDGEPKSKLVINSDISEMKKTEEKLLRAQRLENIGRLAGGIAHDLNNILTPLTMGVDLLGLSCTSPADRTLLATLQATLRRGSDLVRQILSFSRGLDEPRHDMSLAPLIHELVDLFRQTFPRSISIETEVAEDLAPINADPTQLHQVLTNLCVNARDAMPEGGRLRIAACNRKLNEREASETQGLPPGAYVVVEVADSGTGIPSDIRARIFEPFFTTKEVGKGTGLGLSTTQGIVKSHDGRILVESEPGAGSRFRVYLPARDAAQPSPVESVRREAPGGRGELVLVIDDESALLHIAKLTLTSAGYRVLTAQNGVEALAVHGRRIPKIAVVLTDQMMPHMDGSATIAALRRQNSTAQFILCSGLATGQETADSMRAAFLPKPYTVEALLSTVRSVLDC